MNKYCDYCDAYLFETESSVEVVRAFTAWGMASFCCVECLHKFINVHHVIVHEEGMEELK